MKLACSMSTDKMEPYRADICTPTRPSWREYVAVLVANAVDALSVSYAVMLPTSTSRVTHSQWLDWHNHKPGSTRHISTLNNVAPLQSNLIPRWQSCCLCLLQCLRWRKNVSITHQCSHVCSGVDKGGSGRGRPRPLRLQHQLWIQICAEKITQFIPSTCPKMRHAPDPTGGAFSAGGFCPLHKNPTPALNLRPRFRPFGS